MVSSMPGVVMQRFKIYAYFLGNTMKFSNNSLHILTDIIINSAAVTVICVSPWYVYPHTHITSDMCIPGGDTQNTDARLGIRWAKWRLGCEVLVSAVKSRRNQSTGNEKSNRTGKLRRARLTCMVRLLKQYVTMKYVTEWCVYPHKHMYSRCLGYVSIRTKRQLLPNSIQ